MSTRAETEPLREASLAAPSARPADDANVQPAPFQAASSAPEGDRAPDGGADADLHLVSGHTMREALLDARRSLGTRAIVVDHVTKAGSDGRRGRVTLAVTTRVPRSTDALTDLRDRAARLLAEGAPRAAAHAETAPEARAARPAAAPRPRSPLADVERRLREHGGSKALRERVLEGIVAAEDADQHPLDLAAAEVGRAFGVARLPMERGQLCVLAFLGQTGAGKTTTIAKLAARLARAGRRVALATLDVDRIGAPEQLEAFGASIGVTAVAVRDLDRFADALLRDRRHDVVLLDGSGDVTRDADAVAALRERFGRPGEGLEGLAADGRRPRVEVLATLPASASRASLEAVTDRLEVLAPIGAIVTKIDETGEPLPACEHARAAHLDIAFFTNGPDLGKHLVRATPERFADIALTGRSLTDPALTGARGGQR